MSGWLADLGLWHWLLLGLLLLILEMLAPAAFFLWLALGAGLVALVLAAFPGIDWQAQLVLFATFSVLGLFLGRRYFRRYPIATDEPHLNRRGHQYLGRTFTLEQPIVNGVGKLRVDDTTWKIRGADCRAGTGVRVTGVDGVVLLVTHGEDDAAPGRHRMPRLAAIVFLTCIASLGGAPTPAVAAGCSQAAKAVPKDAPALDAGGLSPHFRTWLDANGYGPYKFPRDDLKGGSYGGKGSEEDAPVQQPVVFVHGNSDRAVGEEDGPIGWTAVIRYFLANGYRPSELYATTWGSADPADAAEQIHSFEYVERLRAFIRAVLAYTGAEKIDLIAHSMGVTLARKAIQGGELDGHDLGPPLTDRVDTFVGIAGANRGLATCFWAESQPTCSADEGFYPGSPSPFGVSGASDFLQDLNAVPKDEGEHVFSIWSRADQLIGFRGVVYGRYTSRIPGQDGEKVYDGFPYGHFCVRDLTAQVQFEMIRDHRVP